MSDQLGDREFIERCRGRNVLPTEDIDRLHALAGPVKVWPDNRCDLATLRLDLKVAEIIISDLCASAGLTRADVDVSGANLAQMTIQEHRRAYENGESEFKEYKEIACALLSGRASEEGTIGWQRGEVLAAVGTLKTERDSLSVRLNSKDTLATRAAEFITGMGYFGELSEDAGKAFRSRIPEVGMLKSVQAEMRREHDAGDGHFSTTQVEAIERYVAEMEKKDET